MDDAECSLACLCCTPGVEKVLENPQSVLDSWFTALKLLSKMMFSQGLKLEWGICCRRCGEADLLSYLLLTRWLIKYLVEELLSQQSRLFLFRAGVYISRDWRVALESFKVCKGSSVFWLNRRVSLKQASQWCSGSLWENQPWNHDHNDDSSHCTQRCIRYIYCWLDSDPGNILATSMRVWKRDMSSGRLSIKSENFQ